MHPAALLLPLFLLQAPQAVPAPRIPGSREVVAVGDEVRVLKEESLPPDALKNSDPRGRGSAREQASPEGLQDSRELGGRGLRLYLFTLKPKERISLRLKGVPPERILLAGSLPPKENAMTQAIKFANRFPASVRSTRYELTNSLDEPFPFVLRLGGYINYSYTLEIERK